MKLKCDAAYDAKHPGGAQGLQYVVGKPIDNNCHCSYLCQLESLEKMCTFMGMYEVDDYQPTQSLLLLIKGHFLFVLANT